MHPPTSSTTECTETGARYHEQFRIGTCTFKIFEVILQISYLLQEIFEKRRFSKNALKEIRANGRQWCFPSSLSRRSAVSCLLCSSKACLLPTQLKRTRSHDSWYKIYLQSLYRETVFWLS